MPLKKIVNEVSSAIYSLPWYIARDEGFFADEGLDLEFVSDVAGRHAEKRQRRHATGESDRLSRAV